MHAASACALASVCAAYACGTRCTRQGIPCPSKDVGHRADRHHCFYSMDHKDVMLGPTHSQTRIGTICFLQGSCQNTREGSLGRLPGAVRVVTSESVLSPARSCSLSLGGDAPVIWLGKASAMRTMLVNVGRLVCCQGWGGVHGRIRGRFGDPLRTGARCH